MRKVWSEHKNYVVKGDYWNGRVVQWKSRRGVPGDVLYFQKQKNPDLELISAKNDHEILFFWTISGVLPKKSDTSQWFHSHLKIYYVSLWLISRNVKNTIKFWLDGEESQFMSDEHSGWLSSSSAEGSGYTFSLHRTVTLVRRTSPSISKELTELKAISGRKLQ